MTLSFSRVCTPDLLTDLMAILVQLQNCSMEEVRVCCPVELILLRLLSLGTGLELQPCACCPTPLITFFNLKDWAGWGTGPHVPFVVAHVPHIDLACLGDCCLWGTRPVFGVFYFCFFLYNCVCFQFVSLPVFYSYSSYFIFISFFIFDPRSL